MTKRKPKELHKRDGRKPRYDTFVKPRLDEIFEWATKGMTEACMAHNLGIGESTFAAYKVSHPELADTIKKGRQNVVTQLRDALIRKAKGYEYDEVKVVTNNIELPDWVVDELEMNGVDSEKIQNVKLVRTETTRKRVTEDVAAINLALKNYDKDNWSNDPQALELRRREVELKEKAYEDGKW